MKATVEQPGIASGEDSIFEAKKMGRAERIRRWMIIIGSIIFAIFLVYLLLILISPSMNIGMNS